MNILYSDKRKRRKSQRVDKDMDEADGERWMVLIKLRKVTFTEIHIKLRPHILTFLLIEPSHKH